MCLNKCIYAAELVLGKRTAAASHGFAAKLVPLAEDAEEWEVRKFYSDPGNITDRYEDLLVMTRTAQKWCA